MSDVQLKGFKGLFEPDVSELDELLKVNSGKVIENLLSLPIEQIVSGRYQPRTQFNEILLDELAASIREQGIIQPIIVMPSTNDQYEIIAGERRWRAAKKAGLEKIPSIIKDVKSDTALAFALIENIQREDLSVLDQAQALARLKEEFVLTHEQVAKRVGRPRSSITNLMRLLLLEEDVKILLRHGQLEVGHAKLLFSLEDEEQVNFAQKIVDRKLSVREAEKLIKFENRLTSKNVERDDQFVELLEKFKFTADTLSQKISAKIKVNLDKKGRGMILIKTETVDKLDQLLRTLSEFQ